MERPDFADQIAQNRRWTWVLLLASFGLLGAVAAVVAFYLGTGTIGLGVGLTVALGLTLASYLASDKLALSVTRSQPAPREHFLQLHNVVEQMALAAGIPKPQVYVVHDPAPNAFATGKDPDHAAVAVTTGLLEKLDRDELEGVIAHELAHIRNYDIRVMTVAVATAGAIAVITDVFFRMLFFGGLSGGRRSRDGRGGGGANPIALVALVVVVVLAPIAAALLRSAISRRRESLADSTAVSLTRYPTGLRRALEKLDADTTVVQRTSHATSHLWIESPDDLDPSHKGARINGLFNTHPPLRERIDLLRAMEGLEPYRGPDPKVVADLARRDARLAGPPASGLDASGPAARNPAASTMDLDAIRSGSAALHGGADQPRAGWYQDPSGQPHRLRYWDGRQWTEHVARR